MSQHNQESLGAVGDVLLFIHQRVIVEKHHGQVLTYTGIYQKVSQVIVIFLHCDHTNVRFIIKYKATLF